MHVTIAFLYVLMHFTQWVPYLGSAITTALGTREVTLDSSLYGFSLDDMASILNDLRTDHMKLAQLWRSHFEAMLDSRPILTNELYEISQVVLTLVSDDLLFCGRDPVCQAERSDYVDDFSLVFKRHQEIGIALGRNTVHNPATMRLTTMHLNTPRYIGETSSKSGHTAIRPPLKVGLLTVCDYPVGMDYLTSSTYRNREMYCSIHNCVNLFIWDSKSVKYRSFDYSTSSSYTLRDSPHPVWSTVFAARDAIRSGDFDAVFKMDCDAFIVDMSLSVDQLIFDSTDGKGVYRPVYTKNDFKDNSRQGSKADPLSSRVGFLINEDSTGFCAANWIVTRDAATEFSTLISTIERLGVEKFDEFPTKEQYSMWFLLYYLRVLLSNPTVAVQAHPRIEGFKEKLLEIQHQHTYLEFPSFVGMTSQNLTNAFPEEVCALDKSGKTTGCLEDQKHQKFLVHFVMLSKAKSEESKLFFVQKYTAYPFIGRDVYVQTST